MPSTALANDQDSGHAAAYCGPRYSRVDGAPRWCESRSQVVPGAGEIPAEVALSDLAPGRLGGDRTGIPFSGDRSGEFLRRMILRANLATACSSPTSCAAIRVTTGGRIGDPNAREIANCRGHLEAELTFARPRLIVALGRIAWQSWPAGPRLRPVSARRFESADCSCSRCTIRPTSFADHTPNELCARFACLAETAAHIAGD